jgi:hypothetical protein
MVVVARCDAVTSIQGICSRTKVMQAAHSCLLARLLIAPVLSIPSSPWSEQKAPCRLVGDFYPVNKASSLMLHKPSLRKPECKPFAKRFALSEPSTNWNPRHCEGRYLLIMNRTMSRSSRCTDRGGRAPLINPLLILPRVLEFKEALGQPGEGCGWLRVIPASFSFRLC